MGVCLFVGFLCGWWFVVFSAVSLGSCRGED